MRLLGTNRRCVRALLLVLAALGAISACDSPGPRKSAGVDAGTEAPDAGVVEVVDAGTVPPGGLDALTNGATIPFVGPAATGGRVCSSDGWCWYNPLPQGNDFLAVWGSSDDNVWAVGNAATIFHWDGSSLTAVPSGVTDRVDLADIWGSGPDDVWAVGGDWRTNAAAILHWDGHEWSPSASFAGKLFGISGSGPDDVWAVGGDGAGRAGVFHWDGSGWTSESIPTLHTLTAVWRVNASDVWAVGDVGDVVRWDGVKWSPQVSGDGTRAMNGVWGSAADDVWMAGTDYANESPCDFGVLEHWDGSRLTDSLVTDGLNCKPTDDVLGVWGTSSMDIWGAGVYDALVHWDGRAWTTVARDDDRNAFLRGGWSSPSGEVWVAGDKGRLYHRAGGVWSGLSAGIRTSLTAVWGARADDVWAVGIDGTNAGVTMHWDGRGWTRVPYGRTAPNNGYLTSVWGAGPDDVWATGDAGTVQHWNGAGWSAVSDGSRPGTGPRYAGVWGSSPTDVWIVGNGTILRWDGTHLATTVSGTTVGYYGVWGSASDDVWFVGYDSSAREGIVEHWDGHSFSRALTVADGWYGAVGGSGPDDVWAVGMNVSSRDGEIDHWDGTNWTRMPTGAAHGESSALTSVWAGSPGDAWATGRDGMILHWDGRAWSVQRNGGLTPLAGIWGSAAGDVWAVGDDGTILRDVR